ncbi:UNVERIFIED_CONTAM: hypothetical protein NCL1_15047 [Trichonephila clavipes]
MGTNVGFFNSSKSSAPWTSCKDTFIQDPPHGKDHDARIRVRRYAEPEVIPFFLGISGAIFQQNNVRRHAANIVRDFCSAQHMQLFPLPAYSPDMSPIEYV